MGGGRMQVGDGKETPDTMGGQEVGETWTSPSSEAERSSEPPQRSRAKRAAEGQWGGSSPPAEQDWDI